MSVLRVMYIPIFPAVVKFVYRDTRYDELYKFMEDIDYKIIYDPLHNTYIIRNDEYKQFTNKFKQFDDKILYDFIAELAILMKYYVNPSHLTIKANKIII